MNIDRVIGRSAALACAGVAAVSLAAEPQIEAQPISLLAAAPGFETGAAAVAHDGTHIKRAGSVRLLWTPSRAEAGDAIASPLRLRLDLFDGAAVIAAREDLDLCLGPTPMWFGRLEGADDGYVLLVGEGSSAVGKAFLDCHGLFDLVPSNEGRWLLREHTPDGPSCGVGPEHVIGGDDAGARAVRESAAAGDASRGDSTVFADVLLLYTAQARMAVGGTAVIENLIDLAIADANLAFANSDVVIRLRAPAKVEVDYSESGVVQTDLNRLTDPGDGFIDVAHLLRDQHDCDVVSLIVANYSFYCGYAWIMGAYQSSFAPFAFNVTATACLSNYIFAHEVGHNLGCHHDRDNTQGGAGAFPYSYGWVTPSNRGTVMAYPGIRIPHFSNPDITFGGQPTGVPIGQPLQAHNAQSINNNAVTVVSFVGAYTGPPGGFALLEPSPGTITSNRQPTFRWGGAEQANSYQVEFDNAPDFTTPVLVPQAVAALEYTPPDGALLLNTHYWWRVSAINPLGSSLSTPSTSDFFTPNVPPQPFSLAAPANGASGVGVDPTFQWSPSVDADTYALQCDDDPAFTSPAISLAAYNGTAFHWQGTPLLGLTTYYWRVTATNAVGDTGSTPALSSFETIGVAPGDFALLAPPDGPNIPTRTPTLQWSPAAQADSYSVILDDSVLLDSPVHTAPGIADTMYTVPQGVLSSGVRYYWRAVASNETGDTVCTPATQSFGVLVPPCTGDADGNGLVDFGDVISVLANWGMNFGAGSGPGDANNDLAVTFLDVQIVLANWQAVCP